MSSDGSAVEAPPSPQQKPLEVKQNTQEAQNKAALEATKNARLVDRNRVNDEQKAAQRQESAKLAIDETVQTLMKVEKLEELARARQGGAQLLLVNTQQEGMRRSQAELRVRPIEEYFPKSPENSMLAKAIESFRYEAQGQTLEQLADYNIRFLIREYLQLKLLAVHVNPQAPETGFLAPIENALADKGIRIGYVEQRTQDAAAKVVNRDSEAAEALRNLQYAQRMEHVREVTKNAGLSEDGRIIEAEHILGITLSGKQKAAILAAHRIGEGDTGKREGSEAGVFNYKQGHILQKSRILLEAGFNNGQIRILMEKGIAGAVPPETFEDFQPLMVANPELQTVARRIKTVGEAGNADEEFFTEEMREIRQAVREGRVPEAEANQILTLAQGWRRIAHGEEDAPAPLPLYDNEILSRYNINLDSYRNTAVRNLIARLTGAPVDARNIETVREIFERLSDISNDPGQHDAHEESAQLLSNINDLRKYLYQTHEASLAVSRGENYDPRSLYGEIKLGTKEMKDLVKLALEKGIENDETSWNIVMERFNRLFARADFNSSDPWQEALGTAGSIEIDQFLATIENVATGRVSYADDLTEKLLQQGNRERLQTRARQLRAEYEMRQSLHNINFMANNNFPTEKIAESAGSFKAEQMDLAYKTKGVAMISRFFEQSMFEIIHKHKGFLPYGSMVNKINKGGRSEVEEQVLKRVKLLMETLPEKDRMAQWEIDRAVSLARGMGVMSGRFFEVVAMAGVSQDNPLDSWWANNVVKNLAFFKQLARYNVGVEQNKFLTYDFENRKFYWSLDQLPKNPAENLGNYVQFGMSVGDPKYRTLYINRTNPFRCGSIYTQTGWRYGDWEEGGVTFEEAMYTDAIKMMLVNNPENPLIGIGMWVEKLKNDIRRPDHVHDKAHAQENHDKKHRAKEILTEVLTLSTEVAPLKLYGNLPWFKKMVDDKLAARGITISDEDLLKLGIVQEELTSRRIARYKEYLDNPVGPAPDMYEVETDLNFGIIDHATAGKLESFVHTIHDELVNGRTTEGKTGVEQILYDLEHRYWEVPFIMGTDDLPVELYNFTATGGNTMQRRWGDINSASGATKPYEEMIRNLGSFHSPKDLVKQLKAIYGTLVGHDENVTREVMYHTIEGLALYFKKDIPSRLPFAMGTLYGAVSRHSSYAQKALGGDQMAWDEANCRDFILECREAALITHEQEQMLFEHVGGSKKHLAVDMTRTVGQLLLAAYILYVFSKAREDK